jgi:hypothetical protein
VRNSSEVIACFLSSAFIRRELPLDSAAGGFAPLSTAAAQRSTSVRVRDERRGRFDEWEALAR